MDRPVSFEEAVTLVAAVTLAVAGLWLCLVSVATLVERLTGFSSATVRALTPGMVRRVVLVGCGVAAGAGTLGPAAALPAQPPVHAHGPRQPLPPEALSGLSLPDRVAGSGPHGHQGLDPVTVARTDPGPRPYLVRAGDSLWEIAARHVGRTASAAQVDAAWRALYEANRRVVGADPDILVAGTRLAIPAQLAPDPSPRDGSASPSGKDTR